MQVGNLFIIARGSAEDGKFMAESESSSMSVGTFALGFAYLGAVTKKIIRKDLTISSGLYKHVLEMLIIANIIAISHQLFDRPVVCC